MLAHIIQIALLFAALLLLGACDSPQSNPTENAAVEYLTEEIPPCTPVAGSSVDPCEPDAEQFLLTAGGGEVSMEFGEPPSMRDLLNITRGHVSHIVLRGTYLPNTVRCTAGNPYRPPSYLSYEEYDYVEHSLTINCYADVRVSAYLVGNGPPTLTVQRYWYTYWDGWFANLAAEEGKTEREYIEDLRQMLETDDYLGAIAGREVVLFIGPAASVSTEVWEAMAIWDVQRQEDGTVVAVHPDRDLWRHYAPDDYLTHRSKLEMELTALTQAVTTANQARVTEYGGRIGADASLPMLLTDANQLRQYYTNVGAYDHPDGTPVPPPPVPGEGDPVPDIGVDDTTPGPSPIPPGGVEDSTQIPSLGGHARVRAHPGADGPVQLLRIRGLLDG